MAVSTLLPMLASCSADELDSHGSTDTGTTICVKTAMVSGHQDRSLSDEEPFMLLLWENVDHLETAATTEWPEPYLAQTSPQSVSSYSDLVYDVGVPYPAITSQMLYATGYSPANALTPSNGYKTVTYNPSTATRPNVKTAEHTDFLGCDVWKEVYKGTLKDPFAQEKNKLYFRHLAAKLVFYADRDISMENKQFVRKVQITNLQMSIGGGAWEPLYAPTQFTWTTFTDNTDDTDNLSKSFNFSTSYTTMLDSTIKEVPGNKGVATVPKGGYRTSEVTAFTGELDKEGKFIPNSDFVLQQRLPDKTPSSNRVPIAGMEIDSCYVASPLKEDGTVKTGHIRLRMDISAEMSFDPAFQMPDGTYTDAEGKTVSGTVTDNLTFTRKWEEVELNAIKTISFDDKGKPIVTDNLVTAFKPGNEYRVYIHFNRTGIDIAARQLPWNYGGVHYIAIVGTDPTTPGTGTGDGDGTGDGGGNEGGSGSGTDEQTPTQTE